VSEPTDDDCWALLDRLANTEQGLVLHNGNYRSANEDVALGASRPGLQARLIPGGVREWCRRQLSVRG
jgi:hypothetical protein